MGKLCTSPHAISSGLQSVLGHSVYGGNPNLVKLLLEARADPNTVVHSGKGDVSTWVYWSSQTFFFQSALGHIVVLHNPGKRHIIQALLSAKANVEHRNQHGWVNRSSILDPFYVHGL